VIAAIAAVAAIRPEPHQARMLVQSGDDVVALAPDGRRSPVLTGAGDAAYSPDGTLVAFSRGGDLWLANGDGTGQRRLTATPKVAEWGPAWSPRGDALVYTALVEGARQIRVIRLPTGPSTRVAAGGGEDWSPTFAANGELALVSNRSGTPAIYVAGEDGRGACPYDAVPAAIPPADVRDLAWSPNGRVLAYTEQAADTTTAVIVDDGAAQTQLVPGAQHPVWSPGGGRIAYDDGHGGLSSVASDGSDAHALGGGHPLDWRDVPVGRPLFPNLAQRPPSALVLMRGANGHWLLGFTSMVDNRGPGALWITAHRSGRSAVMHVRQRIHLADGGVRTAAGERRAALHECAAAPPLALPRLRPVRAATRANVRSGGARPQERFLHRRPLRPRARHASRPAPLPRQLRAVRAAGARRRRGIAVGYTDRYPAFFHGQALDITTLRPGLYWLVHRANPDFHLREEHYGDDVASLLVRITQHAGVPTVTPLRACRKERC
jgi:hypothetical protein